MLRAESYPDVCATSSSDGPAVAATAAACAETAGDPAEPSSPGASGGHRRVQLVRMTSRSLARHEACGRSCEDVAKSAADAADIADAGAAVAAAVGFGVCAGGGGLASASVEQNRRIVRGLQRQPSVAKVGKPLVRITNAALYAEDGRDYTDPAQLNVLYPAERVDPALAPYLDMSRSYESLLLVPQHPGAAASAGIYGDLPDGSGAVGFGGGSWQLCNQWQYVMSRPMLFPELHSFQFLDAPRLALDESLVDLIGDLLGRQSARDLAVHLFYYDYVYLLENYDCQLLPGVHCRLQTIVFDEAKELRRFIFFRHNLLRSLVALTILSRRTTRDRVKLLGLWIEVLFLLRNEFKDFFAFRSVMMALLSDQVISMNHTWRLLESRDKTLFAVFQKQMRTFRRFRCVVDQTDTRVIYDLIPLVKFPAHLYTFSFEGHDKQIEDTTMDELVNLELMLQRYSFDGNCLHSVMEHCRTLMKVQSLVPMLKEIFSSETLLKVLMNPSMEEVPTVEKFSELCQSLDSALSALAARACFTS